MPSRVRSEMRRRSKCAMAPKTWKTSSPHGAGRAGRRGAGRGSRRARSPWCRRRGPAPPSQYRSIPGRVLRGILGGPRILFHGVRTASVTTRSSRSTGPPRARIRIGVGIRWTDGKLGRVARDSDRLYVDPPLEPGETRDLFLSVPAGALSAGTFVARVDLVKEHAFWFETRGAHPSEFELKLGSGRPGSLLTLAPHRSGRAGSAASGSSTDSFATRRRVPAGPGSQAMATAIPTACLASSAIRCRDVETGPNLGVLAVFPSNGATCRCPLPSTGSRGLNSPASAVL